MKELFQKIFFKDEKNLQVQPVTKYFCNALQGNSYYNICINCDLTISCNCQDVDCSGQIGNLADASFAEIFQGETAQRFRTELSEGRFPTSVCALCTELRQIEGDNYELYLKGYQLPKDGVMIENTIICNLNCLVCDRQNLLGIRSKHKLSLIDVEMVARNLNECGIRQVCYHNQAESFCSDTILEEMQILKKYNPDILILCSTNGMLLDSDYRREAALLMDHLFISIDGSSQETVSQYQVGASFERQYGNMKTLVELRNARSSLLPVIEWKYVVFNWNDQPEHIETAIRLAHEAGIDLISFVEGGGNPEWASKIFTESDYFKRLCFQSPRGKEIHFRKPTLSQLGWLFERIDVPAWQEQAIFVDSGYRSLAEVCLSTIDNENITFPEFVERAYEVLLGMPRKEFDFHNMLLTGMNRFEVIRFLLSSAEFWRRFPSDATKYKC
jgi:hypothetical protein